MNQTELVALIETPVERRRIRIQRSNFSERNEPKTLLFGHDDEHNIWHVFLDYHGHVYLYIYRDSVLGTRANVRQLDVSGDGVESFGDLIPSSLQPELCDYEFCVYLKARHDRLRFSEWQEPRYPPNSIFAGDIF